jgi:hypothetical protein
MTNDSDLRINEHRIVVIFSSYSSTSFRLLILTTVPQTKHGEAPFITMDPPPAPALPEGTIMAGPCDLGHDCQAKELTRLARFKCIKCHRGLHGFFCCTGEDDTMFRCKKGFGCFVVGEVDLTSNIKKATVASPNPCSPPAVVKPSQIDFVNSESPCTYVSDMTGSVESSRAIDLVSISTSEAKSYKQKSILTFIPSKRNSEIRLFNSQSEVYTLAVSLAQKGETREMDDTKQLRLNQLVEELQVICTEKKDGFRIVAQTLHGQINVLKEELILIKNELYTLETTYAESQMALTYWDEVPDFSESLKWEPIFNSAKAVLVPHMAKLKVSAIHFFTQEIYILVTSYILITPLFFLQSCRENKK